jgi:hypothetical protein
MARPACASSAAYLKRKECNEPVGMPRGQHSVLVELVDTEGHVFTAQTVTFHSPGKEVRP